MTKRPAIAMLPISLLLLQPFAAMAYMGPGAGLTAFGCLLALFAGLWYTLKGFLWLPLKRKFKKPVTEPKATQQTATQSEESTSNATQPEPQPQANENK